MDNLCHTLVGAALGKAGLERRSPLAMATLLIGANLPDVDVIATFFGPLAYVVHRRGWTHGVLLLPLWPFVLAWIMVAWDRLVRRRRHPGAEPARFGALLLPAALAVLSHPFLDWLNSYGMRWLMPFSGNWQYGDTLFIIDPWIWLALGAGVVLTRRRQRRGAPRPERPARIALAVASAYILFMAGVTVTARAAVQRELAASGIAASRVMAAPLPLLPFQRRVVAEAGDRYLIGSVDWLRRPAIALDPADVPKGDGQPEAAAAAATLEGAAFLGWTRFPFFRVTAGEGGPLVWIIDARFTLEPHEGFGIGELGVRLPAGSAGWTRWPGDPGNACWGPVVCWLREWPRPASAVALAGRER